MEGFFDIVSELLKSDLVKGYGWTILVLFVFCVSIVGFIIWFIMDKIVLPSKLIGANNAEKELTQVKEENEKLKKQNMKLKEQLSNYEFYKALEEDGEEFEDIALDGFAKD